MEGIIVIVVLVIMFTLVAAGWSQYTRKPVENVHSGVDITHQRRDRTVGQNTEIWTEYFVDLPAPLHQLSLIDAAAHHFRTQVFVPREEIATVGAPMTSSDVFNGLFEYIEHPDPLLARALDNTEVSRTLMDLTELYDGVWVDRGQLRVLNHMHGDVTATDIDLETLSAMVLQIEEALSRIEPEAVLDFEEAEVQQTEELSVDSSTDS